MKKIFFVFILLIALCFSGCGNTINIGSGKNNIKIIIEAGENYLQTNPYNSPPQFAFWVTDENKNYIDTLFVTKKTITYNFIATNNGTRKEALPYWSFSLPLEQIPELDAVSSATPRGDSNIITDITTDSNIFIFAEFNNSFDYNEYYPQDTSGVNGQPAIVYAVEIPLAKSGIYEMEAIGHSSLDGSNGELYEDLSTLTTALSIVKKISIEIQN